MKYILLGLILLFSVGIFTGNLEDFGRGWKKNRAEKARVEAIVEAHRNVERRQNQARRERIRNYKKVYDFTLQPGQSKKIITNGDLFELSYYGEAIIVCHRGASERWLKTKGSDHYFVYADRVAKMDAITLIRPKDSVGPLGFNIVLRYNKYNQKKEY